MTERRKVWLLGEDQLLRELVEQNGPQEWKSISDQLALAGFPTPRTSKQCRERWKYSLNPEISNHEWSDEERYQILKLHQTYANNWAAIAQYLPGRTDNSIKNVFYSELKKALKKYNRTHKGGNRIMRTRKSLIQDKDITRILDMVKERPREGAEGTTRRRGQIPDTPCEQLGGTIGVTDCDETWMRYMQCYFAYLPQLLPFCYSPFPFF